MLFARISRPQSRPYHYNIPTTSTYGELQGVKMNIRAPRSYTHRAAASRCVEVWPPPEGALK